MNKALTKHQLYGLVHQGAYRLPGIDCEDDYRAWLANQTRSDKHPDGVSSCKKCTVKELHELVARLRSDGVFEQKFHGGSGIDRPTKKQWSTIATLARKRGWDGLEDKRTQDFIQHTAKIDHSRFLTRQLATQVITGFDQWNTSNAP